tara:strand:- start:172 stop:306 length:135 start_codon:yes stop_codon:yes gene_type:complete
MIEILVGISFVAVLAALQRIWKEYKEHKKAKDDWQEFEKKHPRK